MDAKDDVVGYSGGVAADGGCDFIIEKRGS